MKVNTTELLIPYTRSSIFKYWLTMNGLYHVYEFYLLKWQESESQQMQIRGIRKCIGFGLKLNLFLLPDIN